MDIPQDVRLCSLGVCPTAVPRTIESGEGRARHCLEVAIEFSVRENGTIDWISEILQPDLGEFHNVILPHDDSVFHSYLAYLSGKIKREMRKRHHHDSYRLCLYLDEAD